MKYIIDFETHHGFLQILSVTEHRDQMAAPMAFQVRGGARLIQTLHDAVEECLARIQAIDEGFHDDRDCHRAFEGGFVTFRPGEIPVTLVTQARRTTLLIGSRQVGEGVINNLPDFHKALKKAVERLDRLDQEETARHAKNKTAKTA